MFTKIKPYELKFSSYNYKNDIYGFWLIYNNERQKVICIGAVDIFFQKEDCELNIPEEIIQAIKEEIWDFIDKREGRERS